MLAVDLRVGFVWIWYLHTNLVLIELHHYFVSGFVFFFFLRINLMHVFNKLANQIISNRSEILYIYELALECIFFVLRLLLDFNSSANQVLGGVVLRIVFARYLSRGIRHVHVYAVNCFLCESGLSWFLSFLFL